MIHKHDIRTIVDGYFIKYGRTPKRSYSADTVSEIIIQAGLIVANATTDKSWFDKLRQLLIQKAEYYGVNISEAIQYLNNNPQFADMIVQYVKENIAIETSGQMLKELLAAPFGFAGSAIMAALWSFVKPLVPIAVVFFAGMYFLKKQKKR